MKKIFVLIIFFAVSINTVFAEKNYSVNFNGTKFNLLYSIKNKDFGGYLNEYYKKGETYNIWTEMVAVHHFPNAYSPIDRIKDFKDYLGSMQVPSSLTFDDKKNTAIIDFIMISEHNMPIIMEFNIFKYEKSKKCGSIAIQYAKRYTATTTMQIEQIKKDIEKNRKKLINKVKNFEIPEVITKDIDKCISAADIRTDEVQKETQTAEVSALKEDAETAEKEELTAENTEENKTEEISNEENDSEKINKNETEPKQDEAVVENAPAEENVVQENSNENTKENIKEDVKAENNTQNNIETTHSLVSEKPVSAKSSKQKKIKEVSYTIENNKNEFYAVPRSKKELKADVKRNREIQKMTKKQAKEKAKADAAASKKMEKQKIKDAKIKAKQDKAAEKINALNAKKLEKQKAKDNKINTKKEKNEINKLPKEARIQAKAEQKERLKEEKELARGEKIQAKIDKKEYKEQQKTDKIQQKYAEKEQKKNAKEDKIIAKKKAKINHKEDKKAKLQAKLDKKELKKEEKEKIKQEKFNKKSAKKAEIKSKKASKKQK